MHFRPPMLCPFVVTCCAAFATIAHAHGQPIQLAFWGGYSPGVARCQRAISRAAAHCIGEVTAARHACLTPSLAGTPCNTQQLNATVATLRQRALEMVAPTCSSIQLQQLLYIDLSDAYRDIIDVCRRLDTAATSAAYAPALRGGTVSPVDASVRACVDSAVTASAKLLNFSIRARQRALDRIAATQLSPNTKQHLIERGAAQIQRARDELRLRIVGACSESVFLNTYKRDVGTYLAGISAQAGCHAQYVYVQDAVLCPSISCGNGIHEPNEECDDGNDVDGDGCRADCTRGDCTVCEP